jgi:hypothetical protein
MFALLRQYVETRQSFVGLMGYLGGNDAETYAPLQISGYKNYPYPEDFDGGKNLGATVGYWQSHSGDIGGHNPT